MLSLNLQVLGGRGAKFENKNDVNAIKAKIDRNQAKIRKNDAKIDKLAEENTAIFKKTPLHEGMHPNWKIWRANNQEINRLKRESADLSTEIGQLRIKIEPPEPKTFINGYGEATHRYITSQTYERAQRRLDKEMDRRFNW